MRDFRELARRLGTQEVAVDCACSRNLTTVIPENKKKYAVDNLKRSYTEGMG